MVAQGTYDELLKTHLALLTTMEAEEAREADEVDDKNVDENIVKEAEAISKEMKAREEVIWDLQIHVLIRTLNKVNYSTLRLSKKKEKRPIKWARSALNRIIAISQPELDF